MHFVRIEAANENKTINHLKVSHTFPQKISSNIQITLKDIKTSAEILENKKPSFAFLNLCLD